MKTIRNLMLSLGAAMALHGLAPACAAQPAKLKGTVVDAAGQPVAGATVVTLDVKNPGLLDQDDLREAARVETDASGAFDLIAPSLGGPILARKAGLAPAWAQYYPNMNRDLRLVLTPPAVLAGVVVDESGKPVAGADVAVAMALCRTSFDDNSVSGYLSGPQARKLFNARTSADGHFRIEGFSTNATASLIVKTPGKVQRATGSENSWDSLPIQAGQEDIRLVVEPAGIVEGAIEMEDGDGSFPVAQLLLQPEEPRGFGWMGMEPTPAGPDGKFRITEVPEGNFKLRAVFATNGVAEWTAELVPVSVGAGQTCSNVKIKAVRGGLLEVAVRGERDGKPQWGVQVNVNNQSSQMTGSNGVVQFRLPAGEYSVLAYKPAASQQNTSATVEGGKTNRVEIEFAGPMRVAGVVRKPDGQPAAGLMVQLVGSYGPGNANVETDAAGRFELEWSPRQFSGNNQTPCLLIRDASNNLAVAQDIDEETGPLDLRLAPGMMLVGRAECDGKPLTNATAALVFWTGNSGMHLQGLATTNEVGKFEIPALPPGRRYGLYVTAPGYGQKYVDSVESDESSKRVEVDAVELLPANMKVAGQVVDENDKPVSNVYVNLNGDGQAHANARTDREGRFTFNRVCEGTVQLSAYARNLSGNISAGAGDTNVVLKLGENSSYSSGTTSHKLKGIVTGPDGQPASGVEVTVYPRNNTSWVKTSTNGEYNLTWSLQPWEIQNGGDPLLVARDLARNLAVATTIPDESTNLNVQLNPGLRVKGRLTDAAGNPLTTGQVGVWLRAGNNFSDLNQQTASVDANGAFELPALPEGQAFIIYAKAKGFGNGRENIEAGASTNPLELAPMVLKPADHEIAGQVVNADDKPVSGVRVGLNGEGQPDGNVTTGKDGRFKFKVCEGPVQLYASGQSAYANATAEAGDTNVVIQLVSNSSSSRPVSKRAGLVGRPLPDLAPLGLAAEAVPAGTPVLLCLLDAEQRPSRRMATQLADQAGALKQKGVTVLAVQAAIVDAESVKGWTNSTLLPFPLGCVTEKTPATKWVMDLESLPWLILRDADGKVAAEGFPLDELDARLGALKK